MHRIGLAIFACALAGFAHAQPPTRVATPSEHYALAAPAARYMVEAPGVDRAFELAMDSLAPKSRPLRYAAGREIHNATFSNSVLSGGEWRDLPDGMALWRVPVHAAGALTLDFGFRRFFLPPGATLTISNANRRLGPYTDADNPRSGEFWTPLLYGDDALIEVLLPQAMKAHLNIDLGTVHVGYRDIFRPATQAKSFAIPGEGSGSCNIDTICPDGDAWRNEINAEAILVFNGGFCSGQLMQDTSNDHAPLLSTANHCIATPADASSLVVYWKYESPICRAVGSADSAAPVPTDNAIAQTGGATLLATYQPADFTLLRLNTLPPAAAHAYWNGWDRSDVPFSGAVVLHHPHSDAKRISFAAGTITTEDDAGSADLPGLHHWYVDHYSAGVTEAGSSGSGLIDAAHHLRGLLSGGDSSCGNPTGGDYYSRLSTAWEGGGTPDTRVKDWLDPKATGTTSIDGGSCAAPSVTLDASATMLLANQPVTLTANASGGTPPYTYAFDVDGDGKPDNLDATAASLIASYPGAFSGNVSVTVTDHAGCPASASRALVVQAPDVQFAPSGSSVSQQACGNGNGAIDPGERMRIPVLLVNRGGATTRNAYAIFAQDLSHSGQASITLETPVIALPALAPGVGMVVDVTYAVAADATCGAPIGIQYLGTADDNGFSANPVTIDAQTLAPAGVCQLVATCPARIDPITPRRGNFFDPHRSGSGMTQLVVPVPDTDPIFFGAWFTGDASREPTWYVVNDALHANQVNTKLYRTRLTAPDTFPEVADAVGTAQVSVIAPDKFAFTWNLNGVPGGAIYVPVVNDPARSLHSWFNPNQGGWGTFDEVYPDSGSGGNPFLFNLAFLYDASGAPRWTIATDASYVDGHVLTAHVTHPSCPACVWLDSTIGAQAVGPLSYRVDAGGNEFISTNFLFPNAYPGTWLRSDLPIVPLVPQ